MPTPLVSVVIPTHNRPLFLAQAIESVRAQTFTDYEIIVVTNGPHTENIERSRQLASNNHCMVLALPNANLPAARNAGIAAATGEFVAFLDDDDVWMPDKLQKQVEAAIDNNADLISCNAIIDDRGVIGYHRFVPRGGFSIKEELMLHNAFPGGGSGTMARRLKVLECGGFIVGASNIWCEDWDLWRRLTLRDARYVHVDEYLLWYRYHGGNMSLAVDWNRWIRKTHLRALRECPAELGHMRREIIKVMIRDHMKMPYRILNNLSSGRLSRFRRWLRPRTRLNTLRSRLRIRTRARQLLAKLRAKERTSDETDRREERIERTFIALSGLVMGGGVLALLLLARP
jgi:glycosyltransferase involved in cell wall biosynthesis